MTLLQDGRSLDGPPSAPRGGGPRAAPGALARCVGGVDDFARDHWGREPLLRRATGSFGDLLSPADVDELIGPRALRLPFFRLVQDGASLPTSRYTRSAVAGNQRLTDLPDSSRVAALFAGGATIVLQALHRVWPPLADFCAELAAELGHPTQANAYVTPPGAQGFSAHHDTHDVLVLQVDGSKHWTVRAPLVHLPLPAQPSSDLPDGAAAASPVVLDVELRPGDCLYLPRGWLHEAQTTERRSVHLTIGLLQTTWYDVLGDAAGLAATVPALREALPLGSAGDTDVEAFRTAALDWLQQLPAGDLERLVRQRRQRAVPVETVAPLAQLAAAAALTTGGRVRPRRGLAASIEEAGDTAVLVLPDRRLAVPGYVGPALRRALAGPATATELPLDPADGVVLLRRLLREGVCVPAGQA